MVDKKMESATPGIKRKPVRLATPLALLISLIVHFSLFLVVGTVVVFEGAIPPTFFEAFSDVSVEENQEVEAPPLIEDDIIIEPVETPLETPEMDFQEEMSNASTTDLITSSAIDPSLTRTSAFQPLSGSINPDASLGKRAGSLTQQPEKKMGPGIVRTANIFGKTVQSARFGAVLDISFSTHSTIDAAVREITEGFPDALIVLAPGCGIQANAPGEIIDGEKYNQNIEDYSSDKLNSTAAFLTRLLERNKNFADLWKDAIRDDRAYVVHVPFEEKELEKKVERILQRARETGKEADPEKTRTFEIRSTHYAFPFLSSQGCDTIYWMADFRDQLDKPVVEDLAKELKRDDIKVIQHDFDGGAELNDPVKALLYQKTDGEKIIGQK